MATSEWDKPPRKIFAYFDRLIRIYATGKCSDFFEFVAETIGTEFLAEELLDIEKKQWRTKKLWDQSFLAWN